MQQSLSAAVYPARGAGAEYHPAREFAIDLVLFINGLPVATVELKTDRSPAKRPWISTASDRLPYDAKTKRREPLLTFRKMGRWCISPCPTLKS